MRKRIFITIWLATLLNHTAYGDHDKGYERIGLSIYQNLNYSREQLLKELYNSDLQVVQLLNAINENMEIQSILKRNAKRSTAYRQLLSQYHSLRLTLENNQRDPYAYGTDRQAIYAQIEATSHAITKITGYINELKTIQTKIFEIIYSKDYQ